MTGNKVANPNNPLTTLIMKASFKTIPDTHRHRRQTFAAQSSPFARTWCRVTATLKQTLCGFFFLLSTLNVARKVKCHHHHRRRRRRLSRVPSHRHIL